MKLSKLSNRLLKFMVKSYSVNHNCSFSFDSFQMLYPELDHQLISDALYLLETQEYVSIFRADGVAYMTTLLPNAILKVENETFFNKCYNFLKELRSWF